MNSAECEVRSAEWKKRNQGNNVTSISQLRTLRSRGFTLLEVLLAMAILAVLMTVIYTSFSTAQRNVDQAEKLRDETDMARALMTRLSNDIANAYCKPNNGSNVPTVFYGKKQEVENTGDKDNNGNNIRHDSISLTTLTNSWFGLHAKPNSKEMELWEVGYFFKEKPDGKGYTLYRREKRELSTDPPPLEGGDEYEITDQVKSLQFKYYNGSTWADEWNCGNKNAPFSPGMPQLVEIALVLDSGKSYVTQVDIANK